MCWTSEAGFADILHACWQWLRGNRRRNPDVTPEEQPVDPELQPLTVEPVMATATGENFCTPCAGFGKRVKGETYCIDCSEYMCGECVKYHKVLTVTKDHELVSGEGLAEGPPKVKKDKPTQVCKEHDDEVVKYYCPVHDYVGCQVCITLYHRTCKGTVYIQEVSKEILESKEFADFENRIKTITDKANKLIAEVGLNVETIGACTKDAVTAIREIRKRLNAMCDKIEGELTEKAETMGSDEAEKLKAVNDKLRPILGEILELTNKIETFKANKENSNLYMLMKKTKSGELGTLEGKLDGIHDQTAIRLFNFQANADLLQTLKEGGGMGELRLRIQSLEHFIDINVKSSKDSSECSITGSAMMSNCRLVVADHWNKKIKLIDIRANKLTSEFELSSAPWDCTDISGTEVAVSLPNEKKIVLVETKPELKLVKDIEVGDVCRGVAHEDDKLIVTFPEQNLIKIMNMDGVVSKIISSDENGKPLFDNPSYVSIRPDSDVIYVTSWANNTVVCLQTDGTVRNIFTDKSLSCPEQVVVDGNGLVYFCGCLSHNIYQLTTDCEAGKVILTSADGLRNPYSISYSSKTDRFYVGLRGGDVVKVYCAL